MIYCSPVALSLFSFKRISLFIGVQESHELLGLWFCIFAVILNTSQAYQELDKF